MIKLSEDSKKSLIEIHKNNSITLEGNILKLIDTSGDNEFHEYISTAIEKDKESRKKRLEVTKTVQKQNEELVKWKEKNEKINKELKNALTETEKLKNNAEKAKLRAENDLDVLQKKTQYELIGAIVKSSLWIVIGIGVTTTLLFSYVVIKDLENDVIRNAWSNIIGILLTNSFSILGTIMGVKYATEKSSDTSSSKKCEYCSK